MYKVYRSLSKLKVIFLKALRKKKPSIKKFKKLPVEKLQKCSTLNLTFFKNMEKIIHIQGSISVYFDVCIALINGLCTPHLYRKFVFEWVSIDKFLPSCFSWEITILQYLVWCTYNTSQKYLKIYFLNIFPTRYFVKMKRCSAHPLMRMLLNSNFCYFEHICKSLELNLRNSYVLCCLIRTPIIRTFG